MPVEDGKPVRQPEKPAAFGPRASDAVIADPDAKGAVLDARRDPRVLGMRAKAGRSVRRTIAVTL